jgi:hypothetical protein
MRRLRPLLLALALPAAACVSIKPYQRELLARPGMSLGADEELDAEQHVLESREGSAGGYGSVGGG